jgi:hypothetical protein
MKLQHLPKSLLLLLMLVLAAPLVAQQQLIKFDSETKDFGTVKEEDGNPTHDYIFTNISTKPIKLVSVKASCGCTTPQWTQDVVEPGKTGTIKASYNVRPGEFNKTITVRATYVDNVNDAGEPKDPNLADTKILRIQGNVTPRPKTIADYYPFSEGSLRYTTNHVAFGNTTPTETKTQTMKIYNESDKPVVVNRVQAPAHVKLSLTDGTSLKPKDSVEVTITYDGSKVNDWDFVHDNITLMTDDTDRAEKRLYVSAKIQEDFSKMTSADSLAAPRAEFNTLSWDFGNIKATESVSYDFVVKNIGKKELLIRKVKASCGCTATNPDKTNLAPGESTNIKVTFNPAGKSGQQQKSVTVVTNDPFQSSVNLMIKSNIQTEEGKPAATPAAPAHDHSGHDHSGHKH